MTRNNMSMFQNMFTPFKSLSSGNQATEYKSISPEEELSQIEHQLQELQQRIGVIQNKQATEGAA